MTVISATFHNFGKPNLARKTFSFMLEVPIEQTQEIVNFFGSPESETTQWYAIAPIKPVEDANVAKPDESGNDITPEPEGDDRGRLSQEV